MWYSSTISSSFPWIEFVRTCAKGECFLDQDKRIFFLSVKYLKSYHILCFFLIWAMTFLYSCFILSEISNYFLFLGSCALLFQVFPSCHSYFLFYVVPFFTRALHPPARILTCWLLSKLLHICHAKISLHYSTGLVSVFLGFHVFFLVLFPVQVLPNKVDVTEVFWI